MGVGRTGPGAADGPTSPFRDFLERAGRSAAACLDLELADERWTERAAVCLARLVQAGDCLAFTGELGAGKTSFTASLARALGLADEVSSPSFALVAEHRETAEGAPAPLALIHMDLYRLRGETDFLDAGLADYFDERSAVLAIEWAERIEAILPPVALVLRLDYAFAGGGRRLRIYAPEERKKALLDAFRDFPSWEATVRTQGEER